MLHREPIYVRRVRTRALRLFWLGGLISFVSAICVGWVFRPDIAAASMLLFLGAVLSIYMTDAFIGRTFRFLFTYFGTPKSLQR